MKQLLLFSITSIIIFLFCEVFIRLAHIAPVSSTEFYYDIGRGLRKNQTYLSFNEGLGILRFNQYRYIGEDNPPNKAKNTIRVALVGDSYVASFQVFERHYFGNVAENILRKKYPKYNFELLNFGANGNDIGDLYAYYELLINKFEPDFTLFMLSNVDLDIRNQDPLAPKPILKGDSLIVSTRFNKSEIERYNSTKILTQNSSVFMMLSNCITKAKSTPISSILFSKFYTFFHPTDLANIDKRESMDEYSLDPLVGRIVKDLDKEVVIFVNRDIKALPNKFQNLCVESGFRYWDLSQSLNEMKISGDNPVEWKITGKRGHWNHSAHKMVGKFIATNIDSILTE